MATDLKKAFVVALVAVSAASGSAQAQFLESRWVNPGAEDGYDESNWDQVDTTFGFILDDVVVNNGGQANFFFSSPLRDDVDQDDEVTNLWIGSRRSLTDPENSSGSVLFDDLDLIVVGDLKVGHDRAPGTTQGSLTIRSGANASGDLFVEGNVTVGGDRNSSPHGISAGARGEITLDGSVRPTAFSSSAQQVTVGQGVLNIGGDIVDVPSIRVNGTQLDDAEVNVSGQIRGEDPFRLTIVEVGDGNDTSGTLTVGAGMGNSSLEVGLNGGQGNLVISSGGLGLLDPGVEDDRLSRVAVGADFAGAGAERSVGRVSVAGGIRAHSIVVGGGGNADGELSVSGDIYVPPPAPGGFGTTSLSVGVNDELTPSTVSGGVDVDGNLEAAIAVGHQRFGGLFPPPPGTNVDAGGTLDVAGDVVATGGSLEVGRVDYRVDGTTTASMMVEGDLRLAPTVGALNVGVFNAFRPRRFTLEGIPTLEAALDVDGAIRFETEILPTSPSAEGSDLTVGSSRGESSVTARVSANAIENVRSVLVGVVGPTNSGSGASARGELVVRSLGITALDDSARPFRVNKFIQIGSRNLDSSPAGVGVADITGDLVGFDGLFVENEGSSILLRDGEAHFGLGTVAVGGDRLGPVGMITGGASRLELDGYLLEATGLSVGTESSLALHVDGTTRGIGYSALDIAFEASLEGTVEVLAAASLPAGDYDLLTAAAIVGLEDLVSQILLEGLDPTLASFLIVEDATAVGDPSFTLRMTVIPEPSTALLLGIGLASLASACRRMELDATEV